MGEDGPLNDVQAKLEKVNERAVRVVFRGKRTPYEELLSAFGRRTLLEQRLQKLLCTVYKLVNHNTNPEPSE